MSQIPATILTALDTVASDATAVNDDTTTLATAQTNADTASAVVATLQATLATDSQTLATDLASAEALIAATYSPASVPASVAVALKKAHGHLATAKKALAKK